MTITDYSYCLGIEQSLYNLISKLEETSASPSASIEEKIDADSHTHDIRHVLTYVLPMATRPFQEEEDDIAVVQETILGVATVTPHKPSSTETVLDLSTTKRDTGSDHINFATRNSALVDLDSTYEKVYAKKVFDIFFASKFNSGYLGYLSEGLQWLYGKVGTTHSKSVVERLCKRYEGDSGATEFRTQFEQDFEKLVEVLTIAKKSNPDSSQEALQSIYRLREAGNNLMVNKSYPQAIQIYTEAFKAAQISRTTVHQIPQLLTNRAIAYIGMNCFPEAIDDLNLAVSYDSNFTTGWTQLAYCHLYMGSSMISLKCYLKALKCYVAYDEKDLSRKRAVAQTLMPQFVQRLLESIQLCERRARQQKLPANDIDNIVNYVQEVVRSLDEFSTEDKNFYDLDYNINGTSNEIRRLAERNNRLNPSILNSDASQDLLVNSSIEATAIPMSIETVIPRPATQPVGGRGQGRDPFQPAVASLSRVEQFMNRMNTNLQNNTSGDSINNGDTNSSGESVNRTTRSTTTHTTHTTPGGNVIRISTSSSSNAAATPPGASGVRQQGQPTVSQAEPHLATATTTSTPGTAAPGPNYRQIISGIASAIDNANTNTGTSNGRSGVVSNVLQNLLPDYVAEGLESLMGNGARIAVNGEELTRPNGTNRPANAANSNEESNSDDTDMPEVDLD
ncbi:hypothetical protein CLIB1423_04S03950 [[Candida] railenensis]|uniref:Uncharacterized protein n=1 Tax=[Candida] railenensis TaxID=45579 RepID=A0A9P0QNB3_9ASCO|nr:hypothetical protein CLIB1423_04S03950 [[Candida] railenensis]